MSRVALVGENSIGYINALIDIWNNGDCAVLLDWRIPYKTAYEMMIEAEVRKCYIEERLYNEIKEEINDTIDYIQFQKQSESANLLPQYIYQKFNENYSRDEAVVVYSSGTTGCSKGVVLSHFAINTNADAIIEYMKLNRDDCVYIAKTLSHSSTLTGELMVALKAKIKLVIAPTIVPPRYIMKCIEKFKVSIICLNPTLLFLSCQEIMKIKYDISSLKAIYVSGSILSEKLYIEAHSVLCNLPIYNVYGLSEAGPRVSAQRSDCCLSNSVGRAIRGVDIRIVNENGMEVKRGERGIIHVNTPCLYSGYIRGKEKHLPLYRDWLNTGDIGYIDDNGEIHVVDRIDDVIIINSHKIYPTDIEEIVLRHPDVTDCSVICSDTNVLLCEYVTNSNTDISNELSLLCRKKLSINEVPSKFKRVESIIRNLNGKKIRRQK